MRPAALAHPLPGARDHRGERPGHTGARRGAARGLTRPTSLSPRPARHARSAPRRSHAGTAPGSASRRHTSARPNTGGRLDDQDVPARGGVARMGDDWLGLADGIVTERIPRSASLLARMGILWTHE